jgi:type IV pilus assembly protein PilV
MIEVLVSVVILLIALLGTAGLIARSGQSEMESYQRAQALTLLKDMVARINANRQAAPAMPAAAP